MKELEVVAGEIVKVYHDWSHRDRQVEILEDLLISCAHRLFYWRGVLTFLNPLRA